MIYSRGYTLEKGYNETAATPRRGEYEYEYIFRCVHLARISVKSEDSILLEDTVTRSHCILKEIRVVWENFYLA